MEMDNCPLFELESLLQDVDYEDDWTLPYFYDLKHTDPVIFHLAVIGKMPAV